MSGAEKGVYKLVEGLSDEYKVEKCSPPSGLGVRHTQVFLFFICLSVAYMMRAHMSVTVVAMTDKICEPSSITQLNQTISLNSTEANDTEIYNNNESNCIDADVFLQNETSVYRTYNWSKIDQDMIVFAFFAGYTTMMIPMGIAAHHFGGKPTILIALVVNGIISLVTPWMALVGGWQLVAGGRLIQGMTQATMFPSLHTLLARWCPLTERGRLSTYVYAGGHVGMVAAFQTAGQLAGGAAGWPATTWVCAALSFSAAALMAVFGSKSPDLHPRISIEEKLFITGQTFATSNKKQRTPWRHILRSGGVWGLYVAHAGSAVGYIFIFTQIPTYMNRVIGLDIKTNGLYSSLPYVAMYVTTLAFGWASDYSIAHGMPIVNVRRLANTIGLTVSAGFMALFCLVRSPLLAELLLITSMGLHSAVLVGFHINHIDLAPNFAGPVMAVGNMLANLAALSVPAIVNAFVHDVSNHKQWQVAFLTIAGVEIAANGISVILARGDVQPWNDLEQHSLPEDSKEETISMSEKEKK